MAVPIISDFSVQRRPRRSFHIFAGSIRAETGREPSMLTSPKKSAYVQLMCVAGIRKPSTVPANAPARLRPIAGQVGFVNNKGRST